MVVCPRSMHRSMQTTAINKLAAAIGVEFFFPDRRLVLYLVHHPAAGGEGFGAMGCPCHADDGEIANDQLANTVTHSHMGRAELQIGRASCRERVCQYV